MNPPKRCIATKVCALLALFLAGQAVAEPIGVVTDSTGPLLAKTATGAIKVLAVGSSVELSDTLVSRTGAYARVALTDHTLVALGPDTELALDKYSFHEKASPAQENGPGPDEAVLVLSRGTVRVTSGILGTRDTDSFTLRAGTAVIDIHHSTFIAEYRQPSPGQLARGDIMSAPARRAPMLGLGHARGTYTYVQLQSFDSVRLAQITPPGPPSALASGALRASVGWTDQRQQSRWDAELHCRTVRVYPELQAAAGHPSRQSRTAIHPAPRIFEPPRHLRAEAALAKSGAVDCVVR